MVGVDREEMTHNSKRQQVDLPSSNSTRRKRIRKTQTQTPTQVVEHNSVKDDDYGSEVPPQNVIIHNLQTFPPLTPALKSSVANIGTSQTLDDDQQLESRQQQQDQQQQQQQQKQQHPQQDQQQQQQLHQQPEGQRPQSQPQSQRLHTQQAQTFNNHSNQRDESLVATLDGMGGAAVVNQVAQSLRECLKFLAPPGWPMSHMEMDLLDLHGLAHFPIPDFLEHYRTQMDTYVTLRCDDASSRIDTSKEQLKTIRESQSRLRQDIAQLRALKDRPPETLTKDDLDKLQKFLVNTSPLE